MANRSSLSFYEGLLDVSVGGVNFSIDGVGGSDCVNFLGPWRFLWETIIIGGLGLLEIGYGYSRAEPINIKRFEHVNYDTTARRCLTGTFCLIFGMELGYKFSTRQLIWLLNPCHVVTMMQIFILLAPPSKLVVVLFRLQLYLLSGPPLAFILPVTNTRLLPGEPLIYYLQHSLMIIVPWYLIRQRGIYTPEPFWDFNWAIMGIGVALSWHFLPISFISVKTGVSLNSMICPAISDPFYGANYRLWAAAHQSALLTIIGKLFPLLTMRYFPLVERPPLAAAAAAAAVAECHQTKGNGGLPLLLQHRMDVPCGGAVNGHVKSD